MPDLAVASKILAIFPPKFRSFRSTWSSVDPARQTIEYLQERLIEEESYLNAESEKVTALAAMTKKGNPGSNSIQEKGKKTYEGRKVIRCFRCKKEGYIVRECPKRNEER